MLNYIIRFILFYKYYALFGTTFVAAFLLPVPASTALILSGALSAQSKFNIFYVIIVAIIANVLGDTLGYFMAFNYGESFLRKIGFRKILESDKIKLAEDYINNNYRKAIFLTRFTTELGPAVNIISGLSKLSFRKFIVFDILGESSQVLLFALIGYFFGNEWTKVNGIISKVLLVLTVVILIYFISFIGFRKKKGKIEKHN